MEDYLMRAKYETKMEYRKWAKEIPFVSWPSNWLVKAIPPFAGAVVRYMVAEKGNEEHSVSIYLDCYDNLGCYGAPYWEVYPVDEDVARCDMADVKSLLQFIETSLHQIRQKQDNVEPGEQQPTNEGQNG